MGQRMIMLEALLKSLRLEDHVPPDFMPRSIDRSSIFPVCANMGTGTELQGQALLGFVRILLDKSRARLRCVRHHISDTKRFSIA